MSLVEVNIVKEQYQRMPDMELIRFAQNESQHLTIEAFHLLKSEFEVRNLNLGIIEEARSARELHEATKLSAFEQSTAAEFTETIWKFAFDQMVHGQKKREVYDALLKKNIKEDYAYMLVESIEPKARELVDSFDTEIIIGWIMLGVGLLILMFTANAESARLSIIIWGPALIVGGTARLVTSYGKKKKYQTIVSNIEAEKEFENNLFQ